LAGMPSNGSETHSISRTEMGWDTKNSLEIYMEMVYNYTCAVRILGEV